MFTLLILKVEKMRHPHTYTTLLLLLHEFWQCFISYPDSSSYLHLLTALQNSPVISFFSVLSCSKESIYNMLCSYESHNNIYNFNPGVWQFLKEALMIAFCLTITTSLVLFSTLWWTGRANHAYNTDCKYTK